MLKDVIAARLHSASGQAGTSVAKDAVRNALTDAKVKFYWEEMLEAVQVRKNLHFLTESEHNSLI